MLRTNILSTTARFAEQFERCCRTYKSLHIATAWCGNPHHELPYSYLDKFRGRITAIIGRSFNHTHPDSIEILQNLKADVRVFREEEGLFHPKLYLFSSGTKLAIFIGSSNLTIGGFSDNKETNILLEGVPNALQSSQIRELKKEIEEWRSDKLSFVPNRKWLKQYRKAFNKSDKAQKRYKIKTPPRYEDQTAMMSWLRNADWKTYYARLQKGFRQDSKSREGYLEVLETARKALPIPWKTRYLNDKDNRKLMGGIGDKYGWLGHVAASGEVRHLLAAGTVKQKRTLVATINSIGTLDSPINWPYLGKLLKRLVRLGPTMRVWGRILSLVRPDLYCTVASLAVRKNLAEALNVPRKFTDPEGYIRLLKLLHTSSWFNSPKPRVVKEREVWKGRVALMDAIFYEPQ